MVSRLRSQTTERGTLQVESRVSGDKILEWLRSDWRQKRNLRLADRVRVPREKDRHLNFSCGGRKRGIVFMGESD